MQVSALILTFNEARNIGCCLEALSWCDDIWVIDSGSSDDTVAIAERAGAHILTRPFDTFAGQRNYGLEHGEFRHDWVLHLDADEVATPAFVQALQDLTSSPDIVAYRVPSKLMLAGKWLKHAGMYPAYQVRLGHREGLRFIQVGHGQREDLPPAKVGTFDESYLHYNFSHGLTAWFQKHIRYARDEAELIVATRDAKPAGGQGEMEGRRRLKILAARLPLLLRPPMRFFYTLIWRRGLLDGRAGILYALMLSLYEGMIAVFAMEHSMRERSGTRDGKQR